MEKEMLDIATRDNLLEITKEVSRRMQAFKHELIDPYDIYLSNKNLSEIIGKIMEKVAADHFTKKMGYTVKNAHTDKEPDLFFTKIELPVEIKMTSTTTAWTGGEFSRRPYNYFLVSWGGDFDEFFVCATKLLETDWKSNINNRFYGPSLSVGKLREKKDKLILIGQLNEKGGMVREKVNDVKQKRLKD